jgi:AcrR family transcriptional regulator
MATAKTRQKILKTFLDLLSQHAYEDVSLPLLAKTADVKLSALRECYSSKRALVEAFAEMIDTAVLDDRDDEMDDQPAHDRLFDILMIRLDQLAPYRDAVRTLAEAVRRDPALALEFNSIAVRSQRWMLIAGGIDLTGIKGRIVTQGLAVAFGRVVETWLNETDEGLPKTMARLDEELSRGEAWLKRLDSAENFARPFWEAGKRARARRSSGEGAEEAGAETAEP